MRLRLVTSAVEPCACDVSGRAVSCGLERAAFGRDSGGRIRLWQAAAVSAGRYDPPNGAGRQTARQIGSNGRATRCTGPSSPARRLKVGGNFAV